MKKTLQYLSLILMLISCNQFDPSQLGQLDSASETSPDLAIPPTKVTNITNGEITFIFDKPYFAGVTSTGVIWVMNEGDGVTIEKNLPELTTIDVNGKLKIINGSMKNPPIIRSREKQGYTNYGDQIAKSTSNSYDPALSVTYPIHLQTNDSLIATKSSEDPFSLWGGTTKSPVNIKQYQGLIITDFIPSQNHFAPPLIGFEASLRPDWISINIESILDNLPQSYDTSLFKSPDYDIVLNRIKRFNPSYTHFTYVETKREMTPAGFTHTDGYGEKFIGTTSWSALLLICSNSTRKQKEEAIRWILHHHRQWYNTAKLPPDGGHNQGAWVFHVLGDYWINGGQNFSTLLDTIGSNESTAFQIKDQQTLDNFTLPHKDPNNLPSYNWLSPITSISGNTITLNRIDKLKTYTDIREASRKVQNLVLIHPASGYETMVTSVNDRNGKITVQDIGPLSTSQEVYFRAPWIQKIGDYAWNIRNRTNTYSPSSLTSYRRLNKWSAEVLVIKAFGLMHPAFEQIEGYVVNANATQFPTASNDFPQHHPVFVYADWETKSGTISSVDDFWNQHWPTIQNVPSKF